MKKVLSLVLATSLSLCSFYAFPAKTAAVIPTAAEYLAQSLSLYDNRLYVYKDFADGANMFTQKSWMGMRNYNIPVMNEDAAGYSGVSAIMAELDMRLHPWGGYLFNIGVLPAGASNPVNNYGEYNAGLDLTGATKLVFYARGDTGKERVEFFTGGLGWHFDTKTAKYPDSTSKITLGTVRLSKEWKRYEIPLAGKDLSRIACGFGWVASNLDNAGLAKIKFYLDEIYFEFSESVLNPMFLQSYASEKTGTDKSVINNFAYLYDNAAAAMALSYAGQKERARQIADAIIYSQENDRYFSDGRLRNAYMSGNPRSYPGWESEKGGEFARMPGFYDSDGLSWDEDYYAASTSTGNLAWALLALCEIYENCGKDEAYIKSAQKLGDFILTLKDAKGGFTGGYEGWEGAQTKASYKSTEHNIDLISAFARLSQLCVNGKKTEYSNASDHAKAFVLSMYDSIEHCFYTGTTSNGVTISKTVLPLDCNTWALLALGSELKDGKAVMNFLENNMAVGSGFAFQTNRSGIWYEGTAQAALCYMLLGETTKYETILGYLNQSRLTDGSITAADRDGVDTGFLVSGTNIQWKYDKRSHVGATAWLAYAQMGKNPLAN